MIFELKLAWKYFRARRKSLARLTAVVAVVGIAVGVSSLIVAQSLARGFQDEMRDKILANTPHISIFLKDGTEILNWEEIKSKLEQTENIAAVAPTAFENALLVGATETSYAVIKVQSPEPEIRSHRAENQSQEFGDQRPKTKDQRPSPANLISSQISIGAKLAEKLDLKIGDTAEILTVDNQTPARVKVAEIFETGLYEYDSTWIYVSPEKFAALHHRPEFVPAVLSVSVKDIYLANETAQKIREALGENFKVIDWQEANRPLFAALSLERKVSLAIISLIIFVAVLNITTTLTLLTSERKTDIAILRTCGAKTRSLLAIFLVEGLFLGLIGVSLGVLFGLLICAAGNYFKLINLSEEVYSLSYIPFHPNWLNISIIVLIAVALCLISAVYPAFRASRLKPMTVISHQ